MHWRHETPLPVRDHGPTVTRIWLGVAALLLLMLLATVVLA
jgi:hypothetical protein